MKKIMNTSLLPGFPAHHIPYTSNARLGLSHGMPLRLQQQPVLVQILAPLDQLFPKLG